LELELIEHELNNEFIKIFASATSIASAILNKQITTWRGTLPLERLNIKPYTLK